MISNFSRNRWLAYWPLLVLVGLSAAAAASLQLAESQFNAMRSMERFMGLSLLAFAMLKLFDLPGFATGFAKYDLLAQRWRGWGLIYPWLELLLALGYLSAWQPLVVNGAALLLFGFGALGVLRALKQGLNVQCACLGTALKVPLSTVALVENLSMALMAAAMLALHR